MNTRIACESLANRIMGAEDAAALIASGTTIGMSGFTGSGYPKAVPLALARRIVAEHDAGRPFRVIPRSYRSDISRVDVAVA